MYVCMYIEALAGSRAYTQFSESNKWYTSYREVISRHRTEPLRARPRSSKIQRRAELFFINETTTPPPPPSLAISKLIEQICWLIY